MRRTARFLCFGTGALAVLLLSKVHARWIADPGYDFTSSSRLAWAIGYIVLLGLASYATGLPEQPRGVRQTLTSAGTSSLIASLGVSAVQLIIGDLLLPRFVVFGSALAVLPLHVAVNGLARSDRSRAEGRDRVLLVGAAAEAERLVGDLALEPEHAASLVGTLTPEQAGETGFGAHPMRDAVADTGATVIVLDRHAQSNDQVIAQAAELHEAGFRIRSLQGFYEEWLGKIPLSELERASLFFDIREIHQLGYGRSKRLIDLALGLVGVVALLPAVPLVALGNLAGNRGPLMYRQTRVGKRGVLFTIHKFRTMSDRETAPTASPSEVGGRPWTSENDPRITSFGRFLRRSHIDELPQVINILRGDLAVVGPRPEQPHYVEELGGKLPFYNLRHLVRPGLTGWAQVKFGYAGDESDALEKLQYEFFYLRHQNLRFDLRVIGRTARSVAGGSGKGR